MRAGGIVFERKGKGEEENQSKILLHGLLKFKFYKNHLLYQNS